MQGPFILHNTFMPTTITLNTATYNNVDQHEPAEEGAKYQMSDHSSIGSG